MRSLPRLFRAALLCAGLLLPASADAFRLVPIEMEFDPSGRRATQIFRIENENRAPAAIEIHVMNRSMGRDGEDILEDAGDDWVVFPEQIILEPGETQSIRVQWVGDANPSKELSYRLIAEQLPIDIGQAPAQGGQVRLLVRYVASLYVIPPGAKAKLSVESAQPAATPDGPRLELIVRNEGTARQVLRDPTLTVTAGGRTLTLGAEQLTGLTGENLLSGTTRRFLVPWPNSLPQGPLTASLAVP